MRRGETFGFFDRKHACLCVLYVPVGGLEGGDLVSCPQSIDDVAVLPIGYGKTAALKQLQQQSAAELDALLPSILDRAFRGEL